MNSMVTERECRGKYYIISTQEVPGHYEEFEKGTFLGFGIDYEEFESGPAQYTTAIVELKDGKVITTPPEFIQFINSKSIGKPLVKDAHNGVVASEEECKEVGNEISSEDKKAVATDNEGVKKGKNQRSERKRIDHRKFEP